MSIAKVIPIQSSPSSDEGTGMSYRTDSKFFRNTAKNFVPSADGLVGFLRAKHPNDTIFHVSSLTGINPDTVGKWLAGVCLPQLRHLGPLIGVYGPPLLAAVFPDAPRWLDDAVRRDRLAELESEQEQRREEIRRLRAG